MKELLQVEVIKSNNASTVNNSENKFHIELTPIVNRMIQQRVQMFFDKKYYEKGEIQLKGII